jgi:N-acetylmuramoyl-L-alanine amidase
MHHWKIDGIFRLVPALVALVAGLFLSAGAALANETPEVFNVRFGVDGQGRTRIVLDLTEKAKYQVFPRISTDGNKQLSVELKQSAFRIGDATQGTGEGIGHIGAYAYASGASTKAQLLFELNRVAVPTAVFLMEPKGSTTHYRLVIDMSSATEAEFTAALDKRHGPLAMTATGKIKKVTDGDDGREAPFGLSADVTRQAAIEAAKKAEATLLANAIAADRVPTPRRKPAMELPPAKPVIVLDAGHGGKDPGAIGQSGLYEKTVTLASAKTLKAILEKRGYEVILTRDKDKRLADTVKVDLEKRIALARSHKADLFLSIHADAAPSPDVRGASVYTLSDKGSLRLTNKARSRKDFTIDGTDMTAYGEEVGEMLFDISATDSKNQSAILAELMVQHLRKSVITVNNSHRQENLAVLLSPDVPAALLELGFMSNASDEKNLNSKSWRRKTLSAVADALDEYFDNQRPVRQALNNGANGAGAQ